MTLGLMTVSITVKKESVLLKYKNVVRVSQVSYCTECYSTDCRRYGECHYAENCHACIVMLSLLVCRYVECHYVDCFCAGWHNGECHCAACLYADCHHY